MAIQQPVATDKLNSPDHSFSHRVVAVDNAAPVQSIVADSDGRANLNFGRIGNITTVTDTYNILLTDETIVCNKSTAFTATLPLTATAVGQRFYIKNIGTGVVTVDGNGSDTIDGNINIQLNRYDSLTIQCIAASTWAIL